MDQDARRAAALSLFQRYLWAGMTRDADAQAAMFTEDGVLEFPLVPLYGWCPRRVQGRDAVRDVCARLHRALAGTPAQQVDVERSGYALHLTDDPDTFVVEIDTVFDHGGSQALLHVYRLRDGLIARLRDYFAGETLPTPADDNL